MTSLAVVFPGQGSQQVGMLADISAQYGIISEAFAEASSTLGYDIEKLINDGPAEVLAQTEKTQPALLASSVALFRLMSEMTDQKFDFFAGHSLGEYSALVAAGVLSFADAIKLVERRGQLMQKAVPAGEGLMAAVLGLSDDDVIAGCQEAQQTGVVSAVNFNTPGQVVIAGDTGAVERAMVVLKDKGAKRVMPLSVSVPSHCSLMKPAAQQLAEDLSNVAFSNPSAPIVQNRTGEAVTDLAAIKQNLIEQLYMPVLWTKSVAFLAQQGVSEVIECGPGKVLTGLNKRIAKELIGTPIGSLAGIQKMNGAQ